MRASAVSWADRDALVADLARDAGVSRSIETLLREDARTPLTIGIVRPAIVLPADAQTWAESDLRRALAHEIEHIRRNDWLVHMLARIVCAALLVSSARVDGMAPPSSRLGARVRRRRLAAGRRNSVRGAVAAAGASPQVWLHGRAVHGEPNLIRDQDRGGDRSCTASRSARTPDDNRGRGRRHGGVARHRAGAGRPRRPRRSPATSVIHSVAGSRT